MLLLKNIYPEWPGWIAGVTIFLSAFLVFTLSYCSRSPIGPVGFRRTLLFAVAWYGAVIVAIETAHPPFSSEVFLNDDVSPSGARVMMYFGTTGIVIILRAYIAIGRILKEMKPEDRT